jgi:hypothetical protein
LGYIIEYNKEGDSLEGFSRSSFLELFNFSFIINFNRTSFSLYIAAGVLLFIYLGWFIFFLALKLSLDPELLIKKSFFGGFTLIISFLSSLFPYFFFNSFLWISFRNWEKEEISRFFPVIFGAFSVIFNFFISLHEINYSFTGKDFLFRRKVNALNLSFLEPILILLIGKINNLQISVILITIYSLIKTIFHFYEPLFVLQKPNHI